ncbi:MAG: carboxymuconolactone decarboxylase family protein, partial [Halobacteriota archaeon]|nr:carboxymuconolactone decarboxylase family protein [Halobacteriota archaeon]
MIVMDKFRRRTYQNLRDFLEDVRFISGNRKKMKQNREDGIISFAFRERLMLAVTAVNGCRYCSNHHSKQALLSGISKEETDFLLDGVMDYCPEEETPAIF